MKMPKQPQTMLMHPAFVKQRNMRIKMEPMMGMTKPKPPVMPVKPKKVK